MTATGHETDNIIRIYPEHPPVSIVWARVQRERKQRDEKITSLGVDPIIFIDRRGRRMTYKSQLPYFDAISNRTNLRLVLP